MAHTQASFRGRVGGRVQAAPVAPSRFGLSFSEGIPFGARGPRVPASFGRVRSWVVRRACARYLAAVCSGSVRRQARAWRWLSIVSVQSGYYVRGQFVRPQSFARLFAWWVQQVTEPVGGE